MFTWRRGGGGEASTETPRPSSETLLSLRISHPNAGGRCGRAGKETGLPVRERSGAWARSGRGYRRLRQVSPETVGCPRRPRSLQEVSEWPQAAPHKSTFSIRPGVGDRAQHSVCLPGPGGPPAPQHIQSPHCSDVTSSETREGA